MLSGLFFTDTNDLSWIIDSTFWFRFQYWFWVQFWFLIVWNAVDGKELLNLQHILILICDSWFLILISGFLIPNFWPCSDFDSDCLFLLQLVEQRISLPKYGTPSMAKNCSTCSTSTLLNQSTFPKTLFPWPLLPMTNSSVFSTLKNQKNQSLHLMVRFQIFGAGTKIIHPMYYKHLKKGAHQSHLGRKKWAGFLQISLYIK